MTLQTSQVCLHHDESVRSCEDAIPFTQLWMGKPGYYHLLRILSCTDNYTCLHHYRWENKVNPGYPWPHARSTTRQHRRAGTQGVELKTRTRAQRNVSSRFVAKFEALRMSTSLWWFIFTRAGSLQNRSPWPPRLLDECNPQGGIRIEWEFWPLPAITLKWETYSSPKKWDAKLLNR